MTTPASVFAPAGSDAVQRALVGRMLAEPGSISEAAATLLPEDLPGPLAVVYTSVLAVYAAGQPVDPIAVGVHLHRRGRLAEVGGTAYLIELVDAGTRPAAPDLPASPWFDQPSEASCPGTSQPELEEVWAKVISGFIYDENPNDEHRLALTSATVMCRIADTVLICVASEKDMDRFQRLWRERLLVMVKQQLPTVRELVVTVDDGKGDI
ncbi:DnaB-like helicase N-terminal domain-containing protein [Streptomyces cyaneofuscatus]|uniref:DnaB-like helicase N-terminal domain-containing protein n=1 Tax=Streptomyces cyaneofuscatus TaxID=66883 RepID=UPI003401D218